jgi:asparagine synthase (glutamine-hydrolysing)
MCGIAGTFDRTGATLDPDRIAQAVAVMRHRGPDETGFWSDDRVQLGMARLAIIAPDGNHQPVRNEDGRIRVIFNGQIYNHPELRRELQAKGHRFDTEGDTEVIAHAYEEWGDTFLERLNGMFGIAIYDSRNGHSVLLARDRVGIKPLYYRLDDRRLVFGSEVKAVLAQLDETPPPDIEGMLSLLTFEYTYAPHTLFEGINKLKPGHYLRVDARGATERAYWSLPEESRDLTEDAAIEELQSLLSDAVRGRMISDVPLGAFLSGGMDSSVIVALMARHSDRPVKTFSVGFEEAGYNETHYARLVAERYRTDHERITLRLDLGELMSPIELILDDPIGDFSVFSTYLVSRAARQHVTVALSGDGGDELFGGYDTYIADKLARWYGLLGRPLTARLLPGVVSLLRPAPTKKGLINRTRVFVNGAARPADLGHARWMVFMDEPLRLGLLSDGLAAGAARIDPTDHVRRLFGANRFRDPTQRNMYVDSAFYLPENILHKVDRTSMATSLETRVPMLDHRVVESALTMPASFRLKGFKTKAILKRAFGDLLPPQILRRGKQGFSTPMKHWLRGELRPMMMDVLAEARIRRDGFFRPETIERLKSEHLAERADHAHVLWSLMLYCMWLERYQSGRAGVEARTAEAVRT